MATTYRITGTYEGTGDFGEAGDDTLIVTSTGLVPIDVHLESQGAWTVTVNGSVQGSL